MTSEEKRKYASEKKPSMKRRKDGHDYHGERFYMITMAVLGRHPVLGHIEGEPDKGDVSMELTPLGRAVHDEWMHISKGEQAVMRVALDAGFPIVFLTPWGFNTFSKPGHRYYEACASGHFLILAPWPHQNERIPLTRSMCLQLNEMTKALCE